MLEYDYELWGSYSTFVELPGRASADDRGEIVKCSRSWLDDDLSVGRRRATDQLVMAHVEQYRVYAAFGGGSFGHAILTIGDRDVAQHALNEHVFRESKRRAFRRPIVMMPWEGWTWTLWNTLPGVDLFTTVDILIGARTFWRTT